MARLRHKTIWITLESPTLSHAQVNLGYLKIYILKKGLYILHYVFACVWGILNNFKIIVRRKVLLTCLRRSTPVRGCVREEGKKVTVCRSQVFSASVMKHLAFLPSSLLHFHLLHPPLLLLLLLHPLFHLFASAAYPFQTTGKTKLYQFLKTSYHPQRLWLCITFVMQVFLRMHIEGK